MIVTFNKKIMCNIDTISDFEKFIKDNSIILHFKSFDNIKSDVISKISLFIKSTPKVNYKSIQVWIRKENIFYGKTNRHVDYWLCRGYSLGESNDMVSNVQSNNSIKRLNKYTAEDFKRFSVRCVEHWISKGYSIEESKNKVKEIQSTTSLESLQKRYGYLGGIMKRDIIAINWQNTLNSKPKHIIDDINKRKGNGGYKLRGIPKSDECKKKLSISRKKYYTYNKVYNKGKRCKDMMSKERYKIYLDKMILHGKRCFIKSMRTKPDKFHPFYNKKSISIIEEYGIANGYNFKHAENGGEFYIQNLGYFVDGYDEDNNVVLEIDEPHHFTSDGNYIKKDLIRQIEIINELNCKFIRIKYDPNNHSNWKVVYSN